MPLWARDLHEVDKPSIPRPAATLCTPYSPLRDHTRPAAAPPVALSYLAPYISVAEQGVCELLDPNDVQGSVIYLFLMPSFAKNDVSCILELTNRNRRAGSSVELLLITHPSLQVAFSRIGLNVLGVKNATSDQRFDTYVVHDDKSPLNDQS
ncbi:uncharacterized protein PHACADRAFT_214609 [Phanerochaete carnosa HHB-10118-sp]|uniref:Uncharacterized protein n=1 Tax=Phanerochaete carnosa (strain HHB-10118-sp) TaxID=650164 RepID=K5VQQ4_PHACS|nr:uncharacterized protein PHACADRAFT_214609 [Phanerochaete carnosa HHB-10118-sp]EKM48894.1 hypothetical protein PHACADRAFT_214609 [Phanerochaete carnosa HHB-10118-sp]